MEDKQIVVTEKLEICRVQHGMGNSEIILMKKLDVFGILKESIKIPYTCPQFIFLTFLTSLPLIFTMILHEIILQASMSETKSYLSMSETKSYLTPSRSAFYYLSYNSVLETLMMLFQNVYPKVFLLAFLYLVPLHLLDLYSAIITINSASIIYAEKTVRIGEMLLIPFKNGGGFTGPLLTSLYVLFFNCFVLSGLVWVVVSTVLVLAIMKALPVACIFIVNYGILFAVLAVKWIEWSAVWNMGIVFSVLDGRHKLAALGASDHFSSGNRKRGFQLMLLLCVWRIILRFPCYFMGVQGRWVGLVATSFLSCIGNVLKWVVLTVYFYDCKKRTMEKYVDAECEKVASGNTRSTIHNDV